MVERNFIDVFYEYEKTFYKRFEEDKITYDEYRNLYEKLVQWAYIWNQSGMEDDLD